MTSPPLHDVLVSSSPARTEAIGAALARALQPGEVVALDGPLGAGKTCLVRGMVAGLGGDPSAVRSPTFVLHQPHRGRALTLHHIDLYRLGERADIAFLDLDELVEEGVAVIEWARYADLARFAPQRVAIDIDDRERRVLTLAGARDRLAAPWSALHGAHE